MGKRLGLPLSLTSANFTKSSAFHVYESKRLSETAPSPRKRGVGGDEGKCHKREWPPLTLTLCSAFSVP